MKEIWQDFIYFMCSLECLATLLWKYSRVKMIVEFSVWECSPDSNTYVRKNHLYFHKVWLNLSDRDSRDILHSDILISFLWSNVQYKYVDGSEYLQSWVGFRHLKNKWLDINLLLDFVYGFYHVPIASVFGLSKYRITDK